MDRHKTEYVQIGGMFTPFYCGPILFKLNFEHILKHIKKFSAIDKQTSITIIKM